MVSDINTPRPPEEARDDAQRLRGAAEREAGSARQEAEKAKDTLTAEASRLASGAREKAYEGAESGKAAVSSNLKDFTAAVRKASEELGERDQSMAANLVREAASGLEQVSNSIEGQSVQDLTRSVAGFARRQPAAFLIGAALAGVAIGRFAKASAEHDERDYVDGDRYGRDERARGGYRSEPSRDRDPARSYRPAGTPPPAPTPGYAAGASASYAGTSTTPAGGSGPSHTASPTGAPVPGATSTPTASRPTGDPLAAGINTVKGADHER